MTQRLNLTIDDINEKLSDRQIICLSPEYTKTRDKHEWQCLICNNRWFARYYSIVLIGHGCPKCSDIKSRLNIDFSQLNVELKNRYIECLSTEYINTQTKYLWHCLICNNEWFTTYDKIIYSNHGCANCAYKNNGYKQRLNITIEEINKKLKDRNIECLSDSYIGSHDKYQWHCLECGHIWKSTYQNIMGKRKRGCPNCMINRFRGENNPNWKGGYSKKDYPPEWTESKREFIRNRDNRKCQYPDCEKLDIDEKIKHSVHHIDGNKQNCENYNLITLCRKHHTKIENNDPHAWEEYFYAITESYEMI